MFDISQEEDYRELTLEEQYLVNGGERIENSDAAVAAGSPGDVLTRNDGSEVVITQGDINAAQKKLGLTGSGGNPGEGSGGYSGGPSGNSGTNSSSSGYGSFENTGKKGQKQFYDTQKNQKKSNSPFSAYLMQVDGADRFGHGAILVYLGGKYLFFEVNSIKDTIDLDKDTQEGMRASDLKDYFPKDNMKKNPNQVEQPDYKVKALSKSKTLFPTGGSLDFSNRPDDKNSGCIFRSFDTKKAAQTFLEQAGYDTFIKFNTTAIQSGLVFANSIIKGTQFKDYNLLNNNCGTWAHSVLLSPGTGIYNDPLRSFGIADYVPNCIGRILIKSNPGTKIQEIQNF